MEVLSANVGMVGIVMCGCCMPGMCGHVKVDDGGGGQMLGHGRRVVRVQGHMGMGKSGCV